MYTIGIFSRSEWTIKSSERQLTIPATPILIDGCERPTDSECPPRDDAHPARGILSILRDAKEAVDEGVLPGRAFGPWRGVRPRPVPCARKNKNKDN